MTSRRNDDARLLDMLIAARKIQRFIQGMTFGQFRDNEMAQSAVIREFQVIGEAARLISEPTRSTYAHVDWRTMTGMRNRLVHEYFAIRLEVVWLTAQDDIPALLEQLERLAPPGAENT